MTSPEPDPLLGPVNAATTLTLADGGVLGMAQWGDDSGRPLFLFHGHPGSRVQGAFTAGHASRLGLRVIALDRPGMGRSTFQPGRTLLDWPSDVAAVADALGIDQFAVLGVSGGGPPACACAFALAQRVTACGLVVALGPIHRFGTRGMILVNRLGLALAGLSPRLVRVAYRLAFGGVGSRDPRRFEKAVARLAWMLPKVDRGALEDRAFSRLLVADVTEALRQGAAGPAYESWLYTRPWGFELEHIRGPRMLLWHGERDGQVAVGMAHRVAAAIPDCEARFFPGHGHFSLVREQTGEILAALVD